MTSSRASVRPWSFELVHSALLVVVLKCMQDQKQYKAGIELQPLIIWQFRGT